MKYCLLSFDVEEWFQVENLKGAISRSEWEQQNSSVEKNTTRILDILAEFDVKATFFVLGWVAERHKDLVKGIDSHGHEVACHGYGHNLNYNLTNQQLFEDLKKSKQILEDLTGKKIRGYRAPSFSINDRVIRYLKDLDFIYDSSLNPFKLNKRYGSIKGELKPVTEGCFRAENGLLEIPISTVRIFGMDIPMGGGAYFRVFPFPIFKNLLKIKLHQDGFYSFYLHPWELEPEQKRIKEIKLNYRFRHYYGLKYTASKLAGLIGNLQGNGCHILPLGEYVDKICKI